jgi:hypothetical protein
VSLSYSILISLFHRIHKYIYIYTMHFLWCPAGSTNLQKVIHYSDLNIFLRYGLCMMRYIRCGSKYSTTKDFVYVVSTN